MRTPFYERDGITLYCGDSLEVAPELDADSVSAVVTDPPYGLGFMGKAWDHSVPGVPFWRAFMGAMKPGAHLLAFGGSRTYHRMGVAIEDAGLELRDTLMWLYGSGFPKSHDVSKAIDKANGKYDVDLAPFGEYVRECRKAKGLTLGQLDDLMGTNTAASWWEGRKSGVQLPSQATYDRLKVTLDMDDRFDSLIAWEEARREKIGEKKAGIATPGDVNRHTVGGSRSVVVDITAPATPEAAQWAGWGTALKPAHEPVILARKRLSGTVAANVLAHGTGALNIDASRIASPDTAGKVWTRGGNQQGASLTTNTSGVHQYIEAHAAGRWPANVILDEAAAEGHEWSRYFYCAKSSRRERNAGLDGMPERRGPVMSDRCVNCGKGRMDGRRTGPCCNRPEYEPTPARGNVANHHPTVKPLAIMRYLVRLVTPPGGIVLDPFAGSGSTLVACAHLGFPAIGIELSEEYCEIIARRVDHALNERAGRLPLDMAAD